MLKVLIPVTTAGSHHVVNFRILCCSVFRKHFFLRFGVIDLGFKQRDIKETKRDILLNCRVAVMQQRISTDFCNLRSLD